MYKYMLRNEDISLFDFRGLSAEDKITKLKARVLSWQLRRQLRGELQEKIISIQYGKNKSGIWGRIRGGVPNSAMRVPTITLGLNHDEVLEVQRFFAEDQRTAIYGCAVVHETQQSLKEWLLREIPDLLVISTNKEAGPLTGHCPSLNRLSAEKTKVKG